MNSADPIPHSWLSYCSKLVVPYPLKINPKNNSLLEYVQTKINVYYKWAARGNN